jgi:hypothetical protein
MKKRGFAILAPVGLRIEQSHAGVMDQKLKKNQNQKPENNVSYPEYNLTCFWLL